jgi:hypothetical protein
MKHTIISALLFMAAIMGANAQKGVWSGVVDMGDRKLPLVFHFDNDGCHVQFIAQNFDISADKSYTEDGKLKVDMPGVNLTYVGVVSEEAGIIIGDLSQGDREPLPLILRPGKDGIKINHPQTPEEPFPYKTEEVMFQSGDFTLHGTLSLPEKCTARTPVALLVTRMGQIDRDNTIFDHKPFAVIADVLARNGIASLRYDARCYGDTVDFYNRFDVYDQEDDAAAGIEFLRKRFRKVGVIGHHIGGTIALMLAGKGKADFVVSLAGVSLEFRKNLIWQNRVAMEAQGYTEEEVDSLMLANFIVIDKIASGQPLTNIPPVPQKLQPWMDYTIKQVSKPYFKRLLDVGASYFLPSIKCPVLALNGKMDQVVNYLDNLSILDEGLTNCKHKVIAYDGLNHYFQYSSTGIEGDVALIEETINPEVLHDIVDWIKKSK